MAISGGILRVAKSGAISIGETSSTVESKPFLDNCFSFRAGGLDVGVQLSLCGSCKAVNMFSSNKAIARGGRVASMISMDF